MIVFIDGIKSFQARSCPLHLRLCKLHFLLPTKFTKRLDCALLVSNDWSIPKLYSWMESCFCVNLVKVLTWVIIYRRGKFKFYVCSEKDASLFYAVISENGWRFANPRNRFYDIENNRGDCQYSIFHFQTYIWDIIIFRPVSHAGRTRSVPGRQTN